MSQKLKGFALAAFLITGLISGAVAMARASPARMADRRSGSTTAGGLGMPAMMGRVVILDTGATNQLGHFAADIRAPGAPGIPPVHLGVKLRLVPYEPDRLAEAIRNDHFEGAGLVGFFLATVRSYQGRPPGLVHVRKTDSMQPEE